MRNSVKEKSTEIYPKDHNSNDSSEQVNRFLRTPERYFMLRPRGKDISIIILNYLIRFDVYHSEDRNAGPGISLGIILNSNRNLLRFQISARPRRLGDGPYDEWENNRFVWANSVAAAAVAAAAVAAAAG